MCSMYVHARDIPKSWNRSTLVLALLLQVLPCTWHEQVLAVRLYSKWTEHPVPWVVLLSFVTAAAHSATVSGLPRYLMLPAPHSLFCK